MVAEVEHCLWLCMCVCAQSTQLSSSEPVLVVLSVIASLQWSEQHHWAVRKLRRSIQHAGEHSGPVHTAWLTAQHTHRLSQAQESSQAQNQPALSTLASPPLTSLYTLSPSLCPVFHLFLRSPSLLLVLSPPQLPSCYFHLCLLFFLFHTPA